jgi:amino acid permease
VTPYRRNATRTVLVLLIALVSYLVPDFAIILKFLGGLFQSIIAFIIPPLVYNAAFKHTGRIPAWKYALHAAIVTFGVVMAVLSVVSLIVPL